MSRRIRVVWPRAQAATGAGAPPFPPRPPRPPRDRHLFRQGGQIRPRGHRGRLGRGHRPRLVAVWVFALGGPFQHVPGQQVYGSLLLILYTLVAALINPTEG